MITEIGETIDVLALFGREVRPLKFRWRDRVYRVEEVTYRWRTRRGERVFIHFSVTDGSCMYELVYDQSALRWTLRRVEVA